MSWDNSSSWNQHSLSGCEEMTVGLGRKRTGAFPWIWMLRACVQGCIQPHALSGALCSRRALQCCCLSGHALLLYSSPPGNSFLLKLTLLLSYHRGGKRILGYDTLGSSQEKSCACAARLRRRVVSGNCGRDDIQAMGGGHARQRVSLPLQQTGDWPWARWSHWLCDGRSLRRGAFPCRCCHLLRRHLCNAENSPK